MKLRTILAGLGIEIVGVAGKVETKEYRFSMIKTILG